MIRCIYALMLIAGIVAISGCQTTRPVQTVVGTCEVKLFHPQDRLPPTNTPDPNKIRVITSERISSGDLADTAYVGFEYNDWLDFAKWMHEYKAYTQGLKSDLKVYADQDSRAEKELPIDQ